MKILSRTVYNVGMLTPLPNLSICMNCSDHKIINDGRRVVTYCERLGSMYPFGFFDEQDKFFTFTSAGVPDSCTFYLEQVVSSESNRVK